MEELLRLINGYQVSQAIHVAAALGVADHLEGGARSVEDLARETETDPPSLYRLLRALASIGVLAEHEDRHFTLTALGAGLRSDAPESPAAWAAFIGRPYYWSAWSNLLHSVRTGENAFGALHGVDVWSYRKEHVEEAVIFDAAMTSLARRVTSAVLDAYDFGRHRLVVDVGGGHGALLAAILDRHPAVEGVLFDQPAVVAGAPPIERCRVASGSFFDAVPEGADAYVLKAVLHDWDDEPAVAILRTCRRAAPTGSSVLVIERRLGPPNADPAAKFSDLNMLVGPGGRERTIAEYEVLLDAAGLRLVGETPAGAVSVIEARS